MYYENFITYIYLISLIILKFNNSKFKIRTNSSILIIKHDVQGNMSAILGYKFLTVTSYLDGSRIQAINILYPLDWLAKQAY